MGWGESGRPGRAARRSTHQPVEILERRAEEPGDVHLRDAEPLADLGLAHLEPEAHDEDRLRPAVERAQEIAHVEPVLECRDGVLGARGVLDDASSGAGGASARRAARPVTTSSSSRSAAAAISPSEGDRPLRRRDGVGRSLDARGEIAPVRDTCTGADPRSTASISPTTNGVA